MLPEELQTHLQQQQRNSPWGPRNCNQSRQLSGALPLGIK